MDRDTVIKKLLDNRDWKSMCGLMKSPTPGNYYVTGMQQGNLHGEKGWIFYAGYVVQLRIKAGDYGTDLVLLRLPNGKLCSYTNCDFYEVKGEQLELLKSIFDEGITYEEYEDHTKPYTVGGKFPEVGAVVEPSERQSMGEAPAVQITTSHGDGSKTVTVV
ncbi:hypothetical protein [Maridesulfovibrio sp.]|uniref:hypothetical protein n=1 Tax=Maridesulfovibrio sp. TaxID=2795000 RepID=UPI0029C9E271|nr:hypothetical protein [Maridesulfovibrio sp.]